MVAYDYSLDRESVAFLVQLSAREQQFLVDACETVARHPMSAGDYVCHDARGRANQVIDLGGFVLTFWADHVARVVRVLLIERV